MELRFSRPNYTSTLAGNYHAEGKQDTLQGPQKARDIQNWLISYISDLLLIDAQEIDVTIPFDRYGLDSASAIGLTGDLQDWLAVELDPTLIYDYPSVDALTQHLTEQFQIGDLNESPKH